MDCMSKLPKLLLTIFFCLSVGFLGALFTTPAIPAWYANISKPVFSPPNWLFGPVWTVLYILMAISFYLIWIKKKDVNVKNAMKLFGIQLFLNAIWSPVFFGVKNLFLALVIIVFMWIFIRKTILSFGKIDRKASRLLYPYLVWVSFAVILNFSVWLLNK